jgi:hypothetical protein
LTEIKYKSEVIGEGGISARVVAKSVSAYSGTVITTWEYEAPKCILAELNTHRMFSRNAQSSRAVPVSKVIDQIRNNPVTPVHWGSNQAGMVAGEEIDTSVKIPYGDIWSELEKENAWYTTADTVADLMQAWEDAGYHKQIVNRIGEAFTFVRGVITATEIDNFFHLRVHPAADPFIQELARCMWEAYELAEAEVLHEGEWHTPYVEHWRDVNNDLYYVQEVAEDKLSFDIFIEGKPCILHTEGRAKQVSAAGTAQVSFRKLDLSDETVDRVYSRLVDEDTPHASCVEHQATPIKSLELHSTLQFIEGFEDGVSHVDKDLNFWSGNFKHWIQNRKLLPNEAYTGKFTITTKENK